MKQYYTVKELTKADWFPVKSRITINKIIEAGDLTAVNVGYGENRNRYTIPRKAVAHYLTLRLSGKLKKDLEITKDSIIDFLANNDDK